MWDGLHVLVAPKAMCFTNTDTTVYASCPTDSYYLTVCKKDPLAWCETVRLLVAEDVSPGYFPLIPCIKFAIALGCGAVYDV